MKQYKNSSKVVERLQKAILEQHINTNCRVYSKIWLSIKVEKENEVLVEIAKINQNLLPVESVALENVQVEKLSMFL